MQTVRSNEAITFEFYPELKFEFLSGDTKNVIFEAHLVKCGDQISPCDATIRVPYSAAMPAVLLIQRLKGFCEDKDDLSLPLVISGVVEPGDLMLTCNEDELTSFEIDRFSSLRLHSIDIPIDVAGVTAGMDLDYIESNQEENEEPAPDRSTVLAHLEGWVDGRSATLRSLGFGGEAEEDTEAG